MLSLPPALRLVLPLAGIASLAGCATPADGAGGDRISIVASTSVYGSIATQIAGTAADVTSIITQGNQDPHGYEATARDQLTLSRADLVIQNGGGYDPFVAELLETTGSDPVLLTAVEDGEAAAPEHDAETGEHHEHGENEHVWYSLHAMEELAGKLSDELGTLDPQHADDYAANAERFVEGIELLEERVAELSSGTAGATALATEPVPLPLLAELGVEDRTP
jgi:zinc/manganese transport system substrate-binding protein